MSGPGDPTWEANKLVLHGEVEAGSGDLAAAEAEPHIPTEAEEAEASKKADKKADDKD